jgi:hypothetical protein
MTVEEFERSLSNFGEQLQDISPVLLNIGGRIVDQVKEGAPIDSGALRNSIKAVIEDDSLSIAMLYYGIFQNYGVDGIENAPGREVPRFGVPQPSRGNRFGFSGDFTMIGGDLSYGARKTIYKMGLRPQSFFDVDAISQAVADGVAQQLTQDF